jgi:phospholipid transport system substrate-binding protein
MTPERPMPRRSHPTFVLAAALAFTPLAVGLVAAAQPAFAEVQRDAAAEAFIGDQAGRALTILNRGGDTAQKKAEFRAFVDQVADVPRITGFVLGKYRRSITPEQYRAFADAFRVYANSVYETRLGEYHGERLQVTGSIVRAPGDVIVDSQVVGGQVRTPVEVKWRVLREPGGRYRAVDVSIDGIWLAITEQQDFVSTLDNNHGDINVLIAQLRSQTGQQGRRG